MGTVKPGRIPCCNPRCNRTAAIEKHPNCNEIICYKCWKLLPKELTKRYRDLHRRWKKTDRLIARRYETLPVEAVTAANLRNRIIDQLDENWRAIRDYFQTGEKPEGIEQFMKEIGL